MSRLEKLKRQAIQEANERNLGIINENPGSFSLGFGKAGGLTERSYIGTFGPDDNTLPWMNKKNRRNPPIEDYEDDEETFDTFDDWRGSSYYNDPESRWDINRGGYDDTNKRYFDHHREKFGPFRIRKSIS